MFEINVIVRRQLPRHVQELPGGTPVLVGPAGSEQARAALRVLEGRSPIGLDSSDMDVLGDWGRLGLDRPSHPLFTEAAVVVLLARPVLADLEADELPTDLLQ